MSLMNFKYGNPIIIGLCGKAGTGKTISALGLVPQGNVRITDSYWWDHKFLAMPLYEMANLRRDTEGFKSNERIRHGIHNILFDLFGKSPLYGLPDYDVLIELVYDIISLPIELDREKKPRDFLQNVGSLCREIDKDCFIKWLIRNIKKDAAWAEENDKQYVCLVSDVRMPNEAEGIHDQPNGLIIKLTASEEVRSQRLLDRDGYLMTTSQANHESEQVDEISNEYISYTLDTDPWTASEQSQLVRKIASQLLDIELQDKVSPGEMVEHA